MHHILNDSDKTLNNIKYDFETILKQLKLTIEDNCSKPQDLEFRLQITLLLINLIEQTNDYQIYKNYLHKPNIPNELKFNIYKLYDLLNPQKLEKDENLTKANYRQFFESINLNIKEICNKNNFDYDYCQKNLELHKKILLSFCGVENSEWLNLIDMENEKIKKELKIAIDNYSSDELNEMLCQNQIEDATPLIPKPYIAYETPEDDTRDCPSGFLIDIHESLF